MTETFDEKLKRGHIFAHRYWVMLDEKLASFASGDTPEEAIEDARRCNRKMGLPVGDPTFPVTVRQIS